MKYYEIVKMHKDLFTAIHKNGESINSLLTKYSIFVRYEEIRINDIKRTKKSIAKEIADSKEFGFEWYTIERYINKVSKEIDYEPKDVDSYKNEVLIDKIKTLVTFNESVKV